MRTMTRTLILLLSLAAFVPAVRAEPTDDLYRDARRDMDSGHWSQAIEKFGQVAQQGGAEADAALYWKAYAEYRAGRLPHALATLRQLAGSYPQSAWLDDSRALEVEIRGGNDGKGPFSQNDELKLYALSDLLIKDPAHALPMLRKFLEDNHSRRLQEQALFVVCQSGVPEARQILVDVARGTFHPELQLSAIDYLGIAGGDDNVQVLDELYRSTKRSDVRKSVLGAYFMARQTDRIFAIARDARDSQREQAIGLLGPLKAVPELRQLFQSQSAPKVRSRVLDSLGIAGDVETLLAVARQDQDPALRRQANQILAYSTKN